MNVVAAWSGWAKQRCHSSRRETRPVFRPRDGYLSTYPRLRFALHTRMLYCVVGVDHADEPVKILGCARGRPTHKLLNVVSPIRPTTFQPLTELQPVQDNTDESGARAIVSTEQCPQRRERAKEMGTRTGQCAMPAQKWHFGSRAIDWIQITTYVYAATELIRLRPTPRFESQRSASNFHSIHRVCKLCTIHTAPLHLAFITGRRLELVANGTENTIYNVAIT